MSLVAAARPEATQEDAGLWTLSCLVTWHLVLPQLGAGFYGLALLF